jgi:hypothetical protein
VAEAFWLGVMVAGGVLGYLAAHWTLGSEEVEFARRALRRHLARA